MKEQRWLRRKDERAPEILDAALACFSEKGFSACRMDNIARRAGILLVPMAAFHASAFGAWRR